MKTSYQCNYRKKYIKKVFELLEDSDDEAVQKLINEEEAEKFPAEDFEDTFIDDLKLDLNALKEIKHLWNKITGDPKKLRFIQLLSENPILKENKLIVFTESRETAEDVATSLERNFPEKVLLFTGQSSANIREKVIENFDAKAKFPKKNRY